MPRKIPLVIFPILLFLTQWVAGDGGAPFTAMEIFEQSWREADEFLLPEGIAFRYRERLEPCLTADEVEKLKTRMERDLDLAALDRLETYERRVANGADETLHEVWFERPGSWRYNQTHFYNDTYFDRVVTPFSLWAMSEFQLSVLDPNRPLPERRDYPQAEQDFTRDLARLVFGGFQIGRAIGMTPKEARIEGATWTGTSVADGRLSVELRGRYLAEAGRILTESYTYIASETFPQSVGKTWKISGWHFDTTLKTWVAGQIDTYLPGELRCESLIFEGAERLDPFYFDEITRKPQVMRIAVDPLRGEERLRGIADYRHEILYPPSPPAVQTRETKEAAGKHSS